MGVMRYIILSFIGVALLTACTPETYVDPLLPDAPFEASAANLNSSLNALLPGENAGPSADLYMNELYQWLGCHGSAHIIFGSDNTIRWINDGNVTQMPYYLTTDNRLLFGCDYDCGDAVLNYRFDSDTKDWNAAGEDCDYTIQHKQGDRAGLTL